MQVQTAAEFQAAQATLATALESQLAAVWRLLNVADLKLSIPRLSAAVAALVARYGSASAAVAAEYYDAARAAAGVAGRFTVHPAPPPGLDEVTASVKWATRGLWTTDQPDVAAAQTMTTGAAENLVLSAGRDTLQDAVQADRAARGWARIPEPGACAFCVMLATRGAVYKTEQTADFRTHDHCRCQPEPVFTAYEPTAQIREWSALWSKATAGKSGKAARAAFRDALAGK